NILIESYCPSSLPASLSDLRPFQKAYVCSNGCSDGACVECVVGLRQKGKYCSPEGIFEDQKEEKESCENNFECNSNLCINDECLSGSLWAKFIRWLSRIFG
ncbi:MAG: hypothetical protein Q8N99_07570, partial [Nanoarchaeota archaeon]|nr:hypothetical protein [Nanoarchaeota archaeon]